MSDWRPQSVKARLARPPLFDVEIDILQRALDIYRFEYEGHDPLMDRQDWAPVADLIRKLEQLRIGH